VKKRQTRLEGFEEKILALYARGMTTRDIQAQLQERQRRNALFVIYWKKIILYKALLHLENSPKSCSSKTL
jgi:hypothetical protein